MSLAAAATLAILLAAAGWRVEWLTRTGAVAAALVGVPVFWRLGPGGGALLAVFFVSGSALTHLASRRSRRATGEPGPARDAWQVFANGGCAAAGALLVPLAPQAGWAVFTGALAAAQADTWATEVGAFARRPPRLIVSGRSVAPGTSGGVTVLGTAGGLAGGAMLSLMALFLGVPGEIALGALIGGTLGMVVDSVLGATLQGAFYCDACDGYSERRSHGCGSATRRTRGLPWLDNDGVNLAATCFGAGVAAISLRLG